MALLLINSIILSLIMSGNHRELSMSVLKECSFRGTVLQIRRADRDS